MVDKFILGVDLDGVLADYFATVRPIAEEWLDKTNLTDAVDYSFTKWKVDQAPKGYKALHKFGVTQRNMFINMKPMKGAPQVLRRLSEKGIYIRIITNRLCIKNYHAEAIKQTVDWLEYYDIPYWDICFVRDKITVDANIYIEDAPHNIKKMWKAKKNVLVYRNSTNKKIKGNIVKNWKEVEKQVLDKRYGFKPE